MAAIGDDCYFFCTSTCTKGPACPFRHVEAAKTCKIICQYWQTTGCFRPMCKFRHSDFHIQINYGEIPCYWETQPVGCNKPNCVYKHSKPRPDFKTASPKADTISSPKKDNEEKKEYVETFVMPTVKPIIIDPESEASNSSPVKKPAPSVIKEDDRSAPSKEATPTQEIKEKSEDVKTGVKEKGDDEPVKKKKKKPVLKQKNGKPAAVKKKAPAAVKGPPKKKKVGNETKGKSTEPVKKKVKERLGVKSVSPIQKEEESDDDDSADSDDSIENVKVLSVEEIFRQKALESMMKKRAEEGKPLLPEYSTSKPRQPVASQNTRRPAIESQRTKPAVAIQRVKPAVAIQRTKPSARVDRPKKAVVRKLPTPPPQSDTTEEEEEDSDEEKEEEEEEDEKENEDEKDEEQEEESSETSSSSSASSSEDSSESEEETEVRRVVINLDAEQAARDRAKASLQKKRVGDRSESATTKAKKRKVIKDETHTSSFFKNSSPRLSVKDRLGTTKHISQSNPTNVIRNINQRLGAPKKDVSALSEENESNENSDEDVPNIKIRSLEEIRKEKLKKHGLSPVKDRLGPSKEPEEEEDDEETEGRKILIAEDLPVKKAKKRPWTSGHSKVVVVEEEEVTPKKNVKKRPWTSGALVNEDSLETGGEDQRTVSATSPVEIVKLINSQLDEAQSAFESLRERAFFKKTQQLQDTKETELNENEDVESDGKEEEVRKKRKKHKHKHKRHKKSKSERQIYVPPGKKSIALATVLTKDNLFEKVKKVQSPTRALTVDAGPDDIPEYEDEDIKPKAPVTVPQRQRPRPKAGALWAAGLTLSAKGIGGRHPIRMGIHTEKDEAHSVSKAQPVTSKMSTSAISTSTTDNPIPVVKTFSQIMAEKRQKRLQTQDKKGFDETSNISVESHSTLSSRVRSASKPEESKSRVPITPIIFDGKTSKGEQHPLRVKPTASVASFNRSSTSMSISSSSNSSTAAHKPTSKDILITSSPIKTTTTSSMSSMADIQPSYKTARAKKLFKKIKPLSQPAAHSSIHIPEMSESESISNKQHDLESIPHPSPSGDIDVGSSSIKSLPDGKKHRRPSTATESQTKQRSSLDDEFNFFDSGDIDISDMEDGNDVEPIDDLLQDIDELLA